jgi:hypothetical protein
MQPVDGMAAALRSVMRTLTISELATVSGGESLGQVIHAAGSAPAVSVGQTYGATTDFIANHPFFHQGVMNLPIGGGKHFRNVPFVGPGQIGGALSLSGDRFMKGVETTRGTWDAK